LHFTFCRQRPLFLRAHIHEMCSHFFPYIMMLIETLFACLLQSAALKSAPCDVVSSFERYNAEFYTITHLYKAASIMFEVTPQKPGLCNLFTSICHMACHHPFTSTVEAAVCLRICVIAHLNRAHPCLLVPSLDSVVLMKSCPRFHASLKLYFLYLSFLRCITVHAGGTPISPHCHGQLSEGCCHIALSVFHRAMPSSIGGGK
jgi:hypothetical protein